MANIDAGAILTAIRDTVDGAAGDLRQIDATRFDGGVYEGMDDDTVSRRGLVRATFEPRIVRMRVAGSSPTRDADRGVYAIEVEVSVYRHINAAEKLIDATRDAARALAMSDGDILAQALEYPGNLRSDSSSNPTNLVGENLRYRGSDLKRFQLADSGPGLIETLHRFDGFVMTRDCTPLWATDNHTVPANTTQIACDSPVVLNADVVFTVEDTGVLQVG